MTAPQTRVERNDKSRLTKFPRTGAGAARVPATIARTGVQKYGNLLEYRPPEEVFAAHSLASLGSVPVTIGHPPTGVTPANMRALQIGHVSDNPAEPRVKLDGSAHEWLRATLVIGAADVLDRLDASEQGPEVSCGYSCRLDMTPGVDPVTGERYDAVQRDIRFNHVAVLLDGEQPRAGADAKIRLDSQGKPMKLIVIDGVELEFGSDKHLAHLSAAHQKALDILQGKFDALSAQFVAEKARADAADAKSTVDALDKAVEARINLIKVAAKVLPGDYDTAGKSDAQVRADAVSAKLGAPAIAGKSADYIQACFDGLVGAVETAPAVYHAPAPATKADAVVNINDSDEAFRASMKVSK